MQGIHFKDFIAVQNDSAFSGLGIISIEEGMADLVKVAYFHCGHIDEPESCVMQYTENGEEFEYCGRTYNLEDFIKLV